MANSVKWQACACHMPLSHEKLGSGSTGGALVVLPEAWTCRVAKLMQTPGTLIGESAGGFLKF